MSTAYTALSRGDLLDHDLVATMTTSLGTVEPLNVDYGLGVWFDRESCGTAWGHSGAGPGFAIKAWTMPDAHRSVVVMVNYGHTMPTALLPPRSVTDPC